MGQMSLHSESSHIISSSALRHLPRIRSRVIRSVRASSKDYDDKGFEFWRTTGLKKGRPRSAGALASASTTERGAGVRSAGAPACASTNERGASVRIAGAPASASTSAGGAGVRIAGAPASASTSARGAIVRSAGAPASVHGKYYGI
jgi:hypothetical protein